MPKQTVITRKVNLKRINKLLKNEARRRIRERLQAISWIFTGEEAQVVAQKIGRCRQSVSAFIQRYNKYGLKSIFQIGRGPGRQNSLSKKQCHQLLTWIKLGPRAIGYSFNLWDCKKLAHRIKKCWGITLSDERVRQILHKNGASVIRGRHKLPQVSKNLRSKKNDRYGRFWCLPGSFPNKYAFFSKTK